MPPSAADRYSKLARSITIVADVRFIAARRLTAHARFSQWTVALISFSLVVIALFQLASIHTDLSASVLSSMQIALSVLVLVFSLLIGMENHAVRADKMHRCGLDLKNLGRKLESYKARETEDAVYEAFCDRYHEIVNQYENHAQVDFLAYKIKNPQEYYKEWVKHFLPAWIKLQATYVLTFLPYLIVFLVVGGAFWLYLR